MNNIIVKVFVTMLSAIASVFVVAHNVHLYSQFRSSDLLLSDCGLNGTTLMHHIINVIFSVVGAMIIFTGIAFTQPLCILYGSVLLVPMASCNCFAIFIYYNDKTINAMSATMFQIGVLQLGIIMSVINTTHIVQLLGYVIVITSINYTVDDHSISSSRFINQRIRLVLRILQFIAAVGCLTSILFGSIIILKSTMIISLPFVIYGLLKQPFMYDTKNFHLHVYMLSILFDALFI